MRGSSVMGIALAAGLLLVSTVPAHTGGGGHACREAVTDRQGLTITMGGSCFTPTVVRVAVGERGRWVNRDQVAHMVTGANLSWGSHGLLQGGESVIHRFDAAGVYPYYCLLHPGMIGAVVVGRGTTFSQP